MQTALFKTTWLNVSGALILLSAGCLWGQTQPADKPAAPAKPSPSPSPVVGSPDAGPKTSGSPRPDFDVNKTPPDYAGGIQILSDTAGVDFGPYMKELKAVVQKHWEPLIPPSAMPPTMKQGRVVLELSILKDGSVRELRIVSSSGDVALDRAAYGAISSAIPFPPLPTAYPKEYLRLRPNFYYNLNPADTAKPPAPTPAPQPAMPNPKN